MVVSADGIMADEIAGGKRIHKGIPCHAPPGPAGALALFRVVAFLDQGELRMMGFFDNTVDLSDGPCYDHWDR
jgi:hypothetical protein